MKPQMQWYLMRMDSVGVYDCREMNEAHGYHLQHRQWDGDSDYVAGGNGWELRKDPNCDIRSTRTLRNHVLVFVSDKACGIFLSYDVMKALGVDPRWSDSPFVKVGSARFYKFNTEMNRDIEHHVGYERRSDRERFVQQRNAGMWNALLGLAQEYQCEPVTVH